MTEGAQAWVTLATNDSYALGALVLARSLRRVNTSRQLAVMVTPGVSGPMRGVLSDVFDVISEVNLLDSEDTANLALLARPELGITFTKIHCWKLTQFSKCVFLDADTLVIQNSDELFDREELSAAPDAGWPDCFNSGVFVFRPSLDTYGRITNFALSNGSFDGGDQGLLNSYFSDWSQSDASRRLPFVYNMCASATYSYLPAYKVFGQNVKIVHFIGQEKPWLIFYDTVTGLVRPPSGQEHLQELLQAWWNIFRTEVHPRLSPEMGGGDGQSATLVEQVQASFSQIFISAEPSASQFSFYPPPSEPPPFNQQPSGSSPFPHSSESRNESNAQPPEQHPPPPSVPQLLVAIQRYPPEHFWTPPPPPPPPIVYQPPPPPQNSSPESSDSENRHNVSSRQTHDNQAQSSSAGGSGSPQQGINSGSHKSSDGSRNHPPNEQLHQSSQPHNDERREKSKKKKRSKSTGIAGVYARVPLEGEKSGEQLEYEGSMRKLAWEQGHIDYMGKDSFDNIMKRIQQSMAQTSMQQQAKAKSPTPQRKRSPPKQETPPSATSTQSTSTAAPTQPPPTAAPTQPPTTAAPTQPPPTAASAQPPPTATPTQSPQTAGSTQPPPSSAPAQPSSSQPIGQKAVEVTEPKVTATAAPKTVETTPTTASDTIPQSGPTPSEQSAAAAAAAKAQEEERERKEQQERQALEKKLAEQRRAAEQKLEEEKQAAAARAAAAAASAKQASPAPKPEEPKAPPRKESGLGNSMQYGVGLGLLGAAVVLVFAIYAAYSPASFIL